MFVTRPTWPKMRRRFGGWQGVTLEALFAMPSFRLGNVAEIARQMAERRKRYGFSYHVFFDRQAQELALLVTLLQKE